MMHRPESALDIVANSEPKALAYMAMDDIGEATFTKIQQHVVERFELGTEPDTDYSAIGAYAVTFAKYGFANLEMKPGKYNSRIVRHFTPARQEETIPNIGAMLGWSMDHETPLDWVLSVTGSKSSRAPSNSIGLLRAALEGLALPTTTFDTYVKGNPNNTRLKKMVEKGIVVEDESLSRFTIHDPTYKGSKMPFEKLKFETQHIYTTLQVAKELFPDNDWSCDQLLNFSTTLLPQHLRADEDLKARLRARIVNAASDKTPDELAGAINKVDLSARCIKVADQHQDAVVDLVERLQNLKTSPAARAAYRDDAREIYADTEVAKALFVKGRSASPHSENGKGTKSAIAV